MDIDADTGPEDLGLGHGAQADKDQDGARSLRDTQEESGDEDEVDDIYAMDRREAGEAGVDLDRLDGSEGALS